MVIHTREQIFSKYFEEQLKIFQVLLSLNIISHP